MIPAAIIIPDHLPLSMALAIAREHGGFLLTNGRRNCVSPVKLPGYAQVIGGGRQTVNAPEPEAA
jgi:hypothetical protein